MQTRQMQFSDEAERLFVEQAQAMYRELRERARQAPDGQVLDVAERLAVKRGRELTRSAVEAVTQTEIAELEKKVPRHESAPAAPSERIGAPGRGKS